MCAMFRSRHYLDTPYSAREHVSIAGEQMASGLINFCKLSAEKHSAFVDDVIYHYKSVSKEKPSAVKCSKRIKPVYVTQIEEKECSKLEKCSRAELQELIDTTLANIEDNECKEGWTELWEKDLKDNVMFNRADYIDFLKELEEFVCNWNQCMIAYQNEEDDDDEY